MAAAAAEMEVDIMPAETYQQGAVSEIDEILEGTRNIAVGYNLLISGGDHMRRERGFYVEKYRLEVGAVYSAGQLLGYFEGSGLGAPIDLKQNISMSCGVGRAAAKGDVQYPGLSALVKAEQSPVFVSAFGGDAKNIVANLETMVNQISEYACTFYRVTPSTEDGMKSASMAFQGLNDAATCGYEVGLMQGQSAGAVGCARGGSSKKNRGGRRKNMRGGFLDDEPTQLNLLTTALILGGVGGAYAANVGGVLGAGLEFCYRQGRSILYTMNWLKRPCVSDYSIISSLLFKSIPGLGTGSTSCLEIAQRNKIMNTALIGIVTSVYTAAIALGMTVITQKNLTSMPLGLFSAVKENVSRPLLGKLQYIGSRGYDGIVTSFNAIANGVEGGSELVRQQAANIVTSLQALSCPGDDNQFAATAAASAVIANDASAAITQGHQGNNITPEQRDALNRVLGNMSQANKDAFIQAVQLATQIRVQNRTKYNAMIAQGNQAAAGGLGEAGEAAFVAAFTAESNAEAKKQIYALMDDSHKQIIQQSGFDMSTLQGGQKKLKIKRYGTKKKRKIMRKKKTKGRKLNTKRKTKGKKSKGRRKTRNYRR